MLAAYFPNVSVTQQGCSNADKTEPFYTLLSSLLQPGKTLNCEQLCSTPGASSPVLHPAYSTGFQRKNTHVKPLISPMHFKTLTEEVQ